jgi:hypothetical protein
MFGDIQEEEKKLESKGSKLKNLGLEVGEDLEDLENESNIFPSLHPGMISEIYNQPILEESSNHPSSGGLADIKGFESHAPEGLKEKRLDQIKPRNFPNNILNPMGMFKASSQFP